MLRRRAYKCKSKVIVDEGATTTRNLLPPDDNRRRGCSSAGPLLAVIQDECGIKEEDQNQINHLTRKQAGATKSRTSTGAQNSPQQRSIIIVAAGEEASSSFRRTRTRSRATRTTGLRGGSGGYRQHSNSASLLKRSWSRICEVERTVNGKTCLVHLHDSFFLNLFEQSPRMAAFLGTNARERSGSFIQLITLALTALDEANKHFLRPAHTIFQVDQAFELGRRGLEKGLQAEDFTILEEVLILQLASLIKFVEEKNHHPLLEEETNQAWALAIGSMVDRMLMPYTGRLKCKKATTTRGVVRRLCKKKSSAIIFS